MIFMFKIQINLELSQNIAFMLGVFWNPQDLLYMRATEIIEIDAP